jgi:hypothetical protein
MLYTFVWAAISLLLSRPAAASFSVFAGYNPSVQINLGVSSACMAALNTTLNCDKATADMAAYGVDNNCMF